MYGLTFGRHHLPPFLVGRSVCGIPLFERSPVLMSLRNVEKMILVILFLRSLSLFVLRPLANSSLYTGQLYDAEKLHHAVRAFSRYKHAW